MNAANTRLLILGVIGCVLFALSIWANAIHATVNGTGVAGILNAIMAASALAIGAKAASSNNGGNGHS